MTLINITNSQIQPITSNEELLKMYTLQLDVSEATKKSYLSCVKKFLNYVKNTPMSYELLVAYKKELKEKHKARTVNTHITAIKDFFKYLERLGFINYAKGLKKEHVSNDFARDSLTVNQIKDIYNSINVVDEESARANAMIRLLVGTGLRECEIIRANIEDIRTLGNKTVLYIRGKGESTKNKYVVLYPTVIKALQDYFKFREDTKGNKPLFTSLSDRNKGQRLSTRTVQRIVKGLFKDNGIVSEHITTHSTRHTAITLAILNGADITQAQAMARHKDVNTTMIYYHNLNRLENSAEEKLEQLFI